MKKNISIILFVVLVVTAIGLKLAGLDKKPTSESDFVNVSLANSTLKLKVLDTDALRIKGLSGTARLAPDEGMLFVFDQPGYHGIWMKDMNYPIDIVWLDQFKKIIYIEKNISPDTYPQVFIPTTEDMYVVEVNAGFLDTHNIKIGDELKF